MANYKSSSGAVCLAFHQPAAHQIGGNDFIGPAEEGLRESGEILGDELGAMGVA